MYTIIYKGVLKLKTKGHREWLSMIVRLRFPHASFVYLNK